MSDQEDTTSNSAQKPCEQALSSAEILSKIKELLAQHLKTDDELFRSLCSLCRDLKLDAEEFRLQLKAAGMLAPRASEIKTVVLQHEICGRFLKNRQPWKLTLQKARDAAPNALDRLGMKLVDLLLEAEDDWQDGDEHGGWKLNRDERGQHTFTHSVLGTLEIKDCEH